MPDSRLRAWRAIVEDRGLLSSSLAACPEEACGVSLAYLESFASSFSELQVDGYPVPNSTNELWQGMMMHLARHASKSRLWNLVPEHHTGAPMWFVSHSWSGSFTELVASLSNELAPEPGPTEPALADGFKENIFLWIDIFAVNHFSSVNQACDTEEALGRALAASSRGMVLVVDKGMRSISSIWCQYAVFLGAYTKGETCIRMALPADTPSLAEMVGLKEQCACVDMSKASARNMQDKTYILSEVRGKCGLQRTNAILSECLLHALHCKLAWRGSVKEKATLAAMLLKAGELSQLQLLLCTIPELKDNEESLQEMREIFEAYDTDGSGELDEDEFVNVLKAAGWLESDALKAFLEVNSDGEGGISLAEFEAWWKGLLQNESSRTCKGCTLSLSSLKTNLEAMAAFMDRQQLSELASCFRSHKLGDLHGNRPELPPPLLKGSLVDICEALEKKLGVGEHRACLRLLHNLLLTNTELLDFDPVTLRPPDSARSAHAQAQLIAVYLDAVARMLKHQGASRRSQMEYVTEAAQELRAGGSPTSRPSTGGSITRSFAASRSTVRESIKMRFGNDHVASKAQIRDAQMSISQMLATARQSFSSSVMRSRRSTSSTISFSKESSPPKESLANLRAKIVLGSPASGPSSLDGISPAPRGAAARRHSVCLPAMAGPSIPDPTLSRPDPLEAEPPSPRHRSLDKLGTFTRRTFATTTSGRSHSRLGASRCSADDYGSSTPSPERTLLTFDGSVDDGSASEDEGMTPTQSRSCASPHSPPLHSASLHSGPLPPKAPMPVSSFRPQGRRCSMQLLDAGGSTLQRLSHQLASFSSKHGDNEPLGPGLASRLEMLSRVRNSPSSCSSPQLMLLGGQEDGGCSLPRIGSVKTLGSSRQGSRSQKLTMLAESQR